jgi:hypothetical protein
MDQGIDHESKKGAAPNDAHQSPSHEQARADTKEQRDRIHQSSTEYLNAHYDFCKHFTTISLASVAAVGAVAGGAFKNAIAEWPLVSGVLVLLSLIGFVYSAQLSARGMQSIKDLLWDARYLDGEDAFEELRESRRFQGQTWLILGTYTIGLLAFLLLLSLYGTFVMVNAVVMGIVEQL